MRRLQIWRACVALCTLLFIACAAHVRWRLKHPSGLVAAPVNPSN